MDLKKSIVTFSLLFLALTTFVSCDKADIEEDQGLLIENLEGTDKGDGGTIGNSGGDDSDNDYN